MNEARLGRFTASEIWKLFVGGNGKVREGYIMEKAVEKLTGQPKAFTGNKYTEHGNMHEYEAIETFKAISGMNVVDLEQQFFPYNKDSGATPDAGIYTFDNDLIGVVDTKCPVTKFFEHKLMILQNSKPEFQNVPKEYFLQGQMQMMSVHAVTRKVVSDFYLVRYLTSTVVDYFGNKKEINLPIEVRMFAKHVTRSQEWQEKIHFAIEDAVIERDQLIDKLITVI